VKDRERIKRWVKMLKELQGDMWILRDRYWKFLEELQAAAAKKEEDDER